eukprot:1082077-Prorocentrum_minimum.AAC.1
MCIRDSLQGRLPGQTAALRKAGRACRESAVRKAIRFLMNKDRRGSTRVSSVRQPTRSRAQSIARLYGNPQREMFAREKMCVSPEEQA